MVFRSSFLVLPVDTLSGSSLDPSSPFLFAGDSQSSNPADITPRSPTNDEPQTNKPMTFAATSTPHRISLPKLKLPPKTNENEQASCLLESSPKTPIQNARTSILPFSPLLCTQEDAGYESGPEDEGSHRSPLPKHYSQARRNITLPIRTQVLTAPVIPTVDEYPSTPSGIDPPRVIHRQNRPSEIDLAVVPPYGIKTGKAAIGLGLGLPTNHSTQISRASTAPVLMSPPISHVPTEKLLPCRPFPRLSPRMSEIQNPRLQPTFVPGSPSPIDMLPSRCSYFQSPNCSGPLQGSHLPLLSPRDAILGTLGLQPTIISSMPSPTELYSYFGYDTAYPRTPFASPEVQGDASYSIG